MFLIKNKKSAFCLCALITFAAVSFCWLFGNWLESRIAAVDAPYYNGSGDKNAVALCVNVDWGEEYLPGMLRTLGEHDATATFFLTGRWTEKFPEAAGAIRDAGMEIGNHGLKHRSPNQMSYEENLADIRESAKIIEDTLHIKTALFAPASGEIEEQVQKAAADAGYQVILWSVDTIDWQKPAPEVIVERVESKVKDGDIILMHPTENTAAALSAILGVLEEKNLRTVPVSELIK